jgi:hypothetical protein
MQFVHLLMSKAGRWTQDKPLAMVECEQNLAPGIEFRSNSFSAGVLPSAQHPGYSDCGVRWFSRRDG